MNFSGEFDSLDFTPLAIGCNSELYILVQDLRNKTKHLLV